CRSKDLSTLSCKSFGVDSGSLFLIGRRPISQCNRHVRFTPESGHLRCTSACPLWAKSGHVQRKTPCHMCSVLGHVCYGSIADMATLRGRSTYVRSWLFQTRSATAGLSNVEGSFIRFATSKNFIVRTGSRFAD